MKKSFLFVTIILLLCSCSTQENQESSNLAEVDTTAQVKTNNELVEPEKAPLSAYQNAVLKQDSNIAFPNELVLDKAFKEYVGSPIFTAIIKCYDKFFLASYYTQEAGAEHAYYVSFDYGGNQLGYKELYAMAEGLDISSYFITDNDIKIRAIIRDIEIDGEGNEVELGPSTEEYTHFVIDENGGISEIEIPKNIVDYYAILPVKYHQVLHPYDDVYLPYIIDDFDLKNGFLVSGSFEMAIFNTVDTKLLIFSRWEGGGEGCGINDFNAVEFNTSTNKVNKKYLTKELILLDTASFFVNIDDYNKVVKDSEFELKFDYKIPQHGTTLEVSICVYKPTMEGSIKVNKHNYKWSKELAKFILL